MTHSDVGATPTETEIASIVGELVHDGFIELDTEQIVALEAGQYKAIADVFCLWALELVRRRMEERLAATKDYMDKVKLWAEEYRATARVITQEEYDVMYPPEYFEELEKIEAEQEGPPDGWDDDGQWHTTTTGDVSTDAENGE